MKNKIPALLSFIICACNITSCNDNSNNYQTITYKDYINIVKNENENVKDIFIFTTSSCVHCKKIHKSLNKYALELKDSNTTIYELSLDFSSNKFKDETMGYFTGSNDDAIKDLDERIFNYTIATNYDFDNDSLIIKGDGISYKYLFIYTPLILFYENGIEVKVINNLESKLEFDENNQVVYDSFKELMAYPEVKPNWSQAFDLDYYHKENNE